MRTNRAYKYDLSVQEPRVEKPGSDWATEHFSAPENEACRRKRRPPCLNIRTNYMEIVRTRTYTQTHTATRKLRCVSVCGKNLWKRPWLNADTVT